MPEDKPKPNQQGYNKSWQERVADRFKDEEELGLIRGHRYFKDKINAEKDPKKKGFLQKAYDAIKGVFGIHADEDVKE